MALTLPTNHRRPKAVVTGASSGIGASIANKLLSLGWNVCILSRRRALMDKIAQKYDSSQSFIIECDLSDEQLIIQACQRVLDWCSDGALNLLINNAGFLDIHEEIENKSAAEISASLVNWNKHLNVMLKAPLLFTKYLVQPLRVASANPLEYEQGIYDGCIINVSSIASAEMVSPPLSPYCTCKAALNMLTKLTAKELSAKYRIRCNAIKFGGMGTAIGLKGGGTKEGLQKLVDEQCIGRMGTLNDSDQIMLFLADKNKSGFVTGACLNIDGGFGCVGSMGNEYGREQTNPFGEERSRLKSKL